MTGDIGEIIDSFAEYTPISVYRRAAGRFVNGRYFVAPSAIIPISMAVTPADGERLLMLPEGMRTETIRRVFSRVLLRTARDPAGNDADLVKYQGAFWQIVHVASWDQDDATWALQQQAPYTKAGFYDCLMMRRAAKEKPIFYGWAGAPPTNESEILALPGVILSNSLQSVFDVSAGVGQLVTIAIPAGFGTPTVTTSEGAPVAFSVLFASIFVNEIEYRVIISDDDSIDETLIIS